MPPDSLLQRVRNVRISDIVVDQIISLIDEGKIKIGDQLPGERELVNQLQVGRASVREALRILEAQGVVEVRPGRGTYVTGQMTITGSEAVIQWFRQHGGEILEMLEVREILDRNAASLAARRAPEEQIAEIEALLDHAEACIQAGDFDSLFHVDKQFHFLLAEASGNSMLAQLVVGVNEAFVSPRRSLHQLPQRAQQSQQEHRAILHALKQGDPQAAEQAVLSHIRSVRDAITSMITEEGRG